MNEVIKFNVSGNSIVLDQQSVDLANAAGSEMMDACELVYLAATLKAAKLSDRDIVVEIGAYIGNTAVFIHRILNYLANTRTPVLSIDPFERCNPDEVNPQGVLQKYLQNVLDAGAASRCFPLVGFSHDVHMIIPEKIGVLIVDGDHRYEGVKNDLLFYSSKVRHGGMLFIDDYNEKSYPDVFRAFNEFVDARPDYRLLHKSWFAIAQRI